jgi:magnesium-transporting ATPase (P-type)
VGQEEVRGCVRTAPSDKGKKYDCHSLAAWYTVRSVKQSDSPSAQPSVAFGVICAMAGVGLIGIVVAAIAMVVWGGYNPERYPGGIDLVRAGMVWFVLWATILVGAFAAAAVWAWLATRDRRAFADGLSWMGVLVAGVAMLALILVIPGPGRYAVPAPIAAVLFIGIGMFLAGAASMMLSGFIDAIKRRNWGVLIALLLLAGVFLVGMLRRI